MISYNHQKIEKKWQKTWEKSEIFKAKDKSSRPKFYCLDMFPYPSAEGLHVGHPRGYVASDIIANYRRMKGDNVLHPMGWDAFGLPAENYAIKTGIHPTISTKKNIQKMKEQIKSIGLSYDWSREINTTDPKYYKWTQWFFLLLYKRGLAYEAVSPINWCPSCKTGLANEEVVDGRCERCGTEVTKKNLKQWVLKITAYADRLLKGLDRLDWPEKIKEMQRNWIGKSEGVEIKFKIVTSDQRPVTSINIFTTRIDTLYGATYLVLSSEHPIIQNLKSQILNFKEVEVYIEESKKKTERERISETKEKTGIELKGMKAINPATNKEIPIFVADYVLLRYGTGAVMAVPAHDKRDFDFAIKYRLPIIKVIKSKNISKSVVVGLSVEGGFKEELKSNSINFEIGLSKHKREHIRVTLQDDQIDKYIALVKKYLKKNWWAEVIGSKDIFIFKNRLIENFLNQADEIFEECKKIEPLIRKYKNFWEMLEDNLFYQDTACYEDEGILINSGEFSGQNSEVVKPEITKFVDGRTTVNFKLRDWIFSRQRYWGEPIPIVHCRKCGIVPLREEDLPLKLPKIKKYQPTGTGESPLSAIKDWVNTKCPKCNSPAKRETNTMPQWAGSCWYFLRYADPHNSKKPFSRKKVRYWLPVDLYIGGAEHAVLHLLYARFWTKVLYDEKLIDFDEPFLKLKNQGLILAPDGQKISKSKGNIINPDDIIKKHGADTLRLYEMFIGPFGQPVSWDERGLIGIRRFLERAWELADKLKTTNSKQKSNTQELKLERLVHRTIKKVSEDIENFKFNTAVSQLMILVNEMEKISQLPVTSFQLLLKLLTSFAPHICEELWERVTVNNQKQKTKNREQTTSIFQESWPKYDPKLAREEVITLIIQVNGKLRDKIEVEANISKEKAKELAMSQEKIKKWIKGEEIKKIIFIAGKLINIVV